MTTFNYEIEKTFDVIKIEGTDKEVVGMGLSRGEAIQFVLDLMKQYLHKYFPDETDVNNETLKEFENYLYDKEEITNEYFDFGEREIVIRRSKE